MLTKYLHGFKIFWNIFFKKIYGFSALFLLIFVVKLSFLKSIESISVLKKCPASAGILLFFLSYFLEVQTYNLFYLDLLYLDNQQFLAILFDLFLCPIFVLGTIARFYMNTKFILGRCFSAEVRKQKSTKFSVDRAQTNKF